MDPPFNSRATYNVLFKEKSGEDSPAQIKAFTDTWEWTEEAERTYHQDIIYSSATPSAVKDTVVAFRQFIGQNAMMAYLVMMTPRLVELRRVLKPTGSLYLHCDPTASHYLKLIMDSVFGSENFRNEISCPGECSDYTFTRIWLGLGQSLFAERNFCNARLRPLPYPFQNCHHERWFSFGAGSAA